MKKYLLPIFFGLIALTGIALADFTPPLPEGNVTSSSSSSTNLNIAVFDGTTGKIIKDGGATIASISGATKALDNLASVAINTSLLSDTADTDSLGSTTKEWLNAYIGDAGKLYFGLGQDASINRSAANELTITATSGVTVEGAKIDGGVVTGITSLATTNTTYADRVITSATGGVLNFSIGSAAGDDFTVDTDKFVVEGNTGFIGIGTTTPTEKLHINNGSVRIVGSLGSETLSETAFTTHANWSVAGDFDDSGGNAAYTHSTGAGTLTQASGSFAVAATASRRYQFTYTISAAEGTKAATVTTAFADQAYSLDLSDGTHTTLIKSAGAPGNFVVSATSSAASIGAVSFAGSGLDDATSGGTFSGSATTNYVVKIDAEAATDTFTWSDDGGATWDAAGVAITGAAQTLNNGVEITFAATTGHTADDLWSFTALPDGIFVMDDVSLKIVNGGDLMLETGGLITGEGGATGITVKSNGNVGIGTTAPFRHFEVSGAKDILRITDSNNGGQGDGTNDFGDIYGTLEFATGDSGYLTNNKQAWISAVHLRAGTEHLAADAGLAFYTTSTSDYTGVTPKMVIANDGNVGIGTTAPDTKLHIVGGITLDQLAADLADPDASDSNFWFGDGTGTGDAGDLFFKTNVAASIKTWNPYDYSIGGMPVSALGSGTDGQLITWGADALPTTVATGDIGQVLTSNGAGAAPTFQAAGAGANAALSNLASVAISETLVSDTDNTDALGTAAISWSDLFLGNESVITWSSAPSTADITLTHSANTLTLAGGSLALGANNLTTTGTIGSSGAALANGVTATTQSASDNSTKVATTAYVDAAAVAGGTLTGNITFGENTSLVHDNALSADGKYTGETIAGTAGVALAFGDLVYFDPTDSRWELADANIAAGSDGDPRGILGICVLAAAGDGSATTILLRGFIRADTAFPALTINAPVYVSETAGDVVVAQPTTADVVIRVLGFGYTADSMYFNPSNDYITHT